MGDRKVGSSIDQLAAELLRTCLEHKDIRTEVGSLSIIMLCQDFIGAAIHHVTSVLCVGVCAHHIDVFVISCVRCIVN